VAASASASTSASVLVMQPSGRPVGRRISIYAMDPEAPRPSGIRIGRRIGQILAVALAGREGGERGGWLATFSAWKNIGSVLKIVGVFM
jgi:hypothetical protein